MATTTATSTTKRKPVKAASRSRSRQSRGQSVAGKWARGQAARFGRWSLRSTVRAGKWSHRRVLAPAGRRVAKVAGRKGRAAVVAIAEGAERRRLTGSFRSASYTCSECPGTKFTKDQYADHIKTHGATYKIPAGLVAGKAAAELTATTPTKQPAPAAVPTPAAKPPVAAAKPAPAPMPSWATTDSGTGTPVAAAVPTPLFGRRPAARPAPTAATTALNTHLNTAKRSTPAMAEMQQLVRAADSLIELVPATAEELDDTLSQLALAWTKVADSISGYAEMLDSEVRIDPRVTRSIYDGADTVASLGKAFRDARAQFRKVYEAEFDAMDSGARKVAVDGFWQDTA